MGAQARLAGGSTLKLKLMSPHRIQFHQARVSTIELRLKEIQALLHPLLSEQLPLRAELADHESILFIAKYGIRLRDVESSRGRGKPWFGDVGKFACWLSRHKSKKHWVEWNGVIYRRDDILNGRLPSMPGLARHLKR